MNKTILILTIALCSKSLFGQVSIGLAIGDNFCKVKRTIDYSANPYLTGPDNQDFTVANGFTIGIPVEINLSERISLFTKFSYMQKGSKSVYETSSDELISKIEGTVKYNYLELPVLGKFCVVKKSINVYLSIGPSVGYMLSGRGKYKISVHDIALNTSTNRDYDEKIKGDELEDAGLNRLDVSLAVGAGIDFKVWIGKIFFDINYLHGFTDMTNENLELNEGIEMYNRGVRASFGYLIPLSKQNK